MKPGIALRTTRKIPSGRHRGRDQCGRFSAEQNALSRLGGYAGVGLGLLVGTGLAIGAGHAFTAHHVPEIPSVVFMGAGVLMAAAAAGMAFRIRKGWRLLRAPAELVPHPVAGGHAF